MLVPGLLVVALLPCVVVLSKNAAVLSHVLPSDLWIHQSLDNLIEQLINNSINPSVPRAPAVVNVVILVVVVA